ncbi:MAG TPA: Na+/H+ antiporter NhaC family protein, partial [Xanthomonadales bacterium]|nr:Na+/H+ antiporter NhaC family protein [Xanthomonadales bacterium]
EVLEKDRALQNLWSSGHDVTDQTAQPVSLVTALMAIPAGLDRMSGLIFMVLIIGGMFGILTRSGAIDTGLERLLSHMRGNLYLLVPALMIIFSAGSTFLGLASEYLLIIPIMVALSNRLGMSNLVGLAIVTVAVKAGYMASVTNPIPLTIAQPLLGLQIFSGAGLRFACWLVFLVIGILYVLWMIRSQHATSLQAEVEFSSAPLTVRHTAVIALLSLGIAFLVFASNHWQWKHHELSAYYIALSAVLAVAGGLSAQEAAEAFVSGMKKILMACMLIGVASAVAITLEWGQVLDSVVHGLTSLLGEGNPVRAVLGMFGAQLTLDFLIPSTSGQAAISMPIMGPLGQLSGVPPQSTVLAFLFGNGITNLLTPTSGTLLAYLATAQVNWVDWAKAVFWLWLIYIATAVALLVFAVNLGG